jgi:two-component system, LytTR family, sensor kinase
MATMLNQPVLINVLGHAAGALIFSIFLILLYSRRGWAGGSGRYLSGVAAILSLVWNLGSLLVLVWHDLPATVLDFVAAVSFSVLSLLPAVLLQASLQGRFHSLVSSGYLLSFAAVLMHFWELRKNGAALHQRALLIITIGFLLLTAIGVMRSALGREVNGRSGGIRTIASMSLALFAMSFVHFGTGHASQAWSSELLIHHAGIPLALFVLLQDDRFVLLDAFVRFLVNALLAAILAAVFIAVAFRPAVVERVLREPLQEAFLLIGICLLLVAFAWLRSAVQTWLTHAIFRRGGLEYLPSRVEDAPGFSSEEQYLDWAAAVIAAAVRTKDYIVISQKDLNEFGSLHIPVSASPQLRNSSLRQWSWAEAILPVRFAPGNLRIVLLGRRQGGQRYLSEDLDALARAASEIAERIEEMQRQEMKRLVTQAELRALQSQINPHFLFNALNTLYGSIPRGAAGARRMVLNLAQIFRYFLQSDKSFVPLSQEIEIVRAYLEVEQLRLGERLRLEIHVDHGAGDVPIPVLSIQPLVENAIKHGVAQSSESGYVRIKCELHVQQLRVSVENSASGPVPESAGTGIGLQNVRRRLEICYGPTAHLRLTIGAQKSLAELEIPLVDLSAQQYLYVES